MKVVRQEGAYVRKQVSEILLRENNRRNELLKIAGKSRSAEYYQSLLVGVEHESVARPIDAKLVDRGSHVRQEREIGRCPPLFADDNSQLVDQLGLPQFSERRAGES